MTKKGVMNITLINCDKGDNNYLPAVNSPINVNKTNFDTAVKPLLK